jgi:cell division septation protein DedD
MGKAWSLVTFLVAIPALGGCALPPAMVVASYSADVVSYAATGKTVTDHAYSAIARSDCSFIRILRDKPICVDTPDPPAAPHQLAAAPASTLAETAPPPARERYVVIGSFLETSNAEHTRARYAAFHSAIVPALVHGKHFHRVVAGPLSPREEARLKEKLVADAPELKPARG